jgi:hypothetical protein
MVELGMPLDAGAEPSWPAYGNGKQGLAVQVNRRAGFVVRPATNTESQSIRDTGVSPGLVQAKGL